MYGAGTSEYYFKHLAGIQQAPDSRGWEGIVLRPSVYIPSQNNSICANLSHAKASLVTSRGLLSAAWQCADAVVPPPPPSPDGRVVPAVSTDSLCPASSGKLGGNVVEKWSAGRTHEIGTLRLNCTDGGTMKAIDYASYGASTGNCSAGFVRSPTCDAKGTTAKVAAACVGKSSCAVTASSQAFGDPCLMHVKSLAVIATGCKGTTSFAPGAGPSPNPAGAAAAFKYDVTIPVGATADVHVPLMGMEDAHVTESDAAVWADGKFVAGAKGVRSVVPQPAAGTVVAQVGSGSYSFAVHGAAAVASRLAQ